MQPGVGRVVSRAGRGAALTLAVVAALGPVLFALLTSLKRQTDIFAYPPAWTFIPTLDNWRDVLQGSDFLIYYRNSLLISLTTSLVVVAMAAPAGYAQARWPVWQKENLAFWMLSQGMTPPVAVVLPLVIFFSAFHMLDTYHGLILIYVAFNLPFSVWLLRNFFDDVPREVEEAAEVDGASPAGVFWRVSLPLVAPGLVACAVYSFVISINEFFLAFVLTGTSVRPASVAILQFLPTGVRGTLYGQAAAASLLVMLPALVLFLVLQRYLVAGMTFGSVRR